MTSKSITVRDYHTEIPGEIHDGAWYFPTCYSTNANGKQIEWTVYVRAIKMTDPTMPLADITEDMFLPITPDLFDNKPLPPNVFGYIRVNSCLSGGKVRAIVPNIVKTGKGLKTKAATNTFCQAMRDALGLYNKQLSKSHSLQEGGNNTSSDSTNLTMYPPMLAKIFGDQKKPIEYPVSVQRKYNGIRAVAALNDNSVVIYSRKKKPYFGFEGIRKDIKLLLNTNNSIYLDGELYRHEVPLQIISGIARREVHVTDEQKKVEDTIEFMIYDCFMPDKPTLTYVERRMILETLFANTVVEDSKCKLVETFTADDRDAVITLYKQFLAEGYEGAMVRINRPYEYSYNDSHSKFLLKLKETFDAEYKIINWETGSKGKAANALMIVCETADGKQFNVTPAMELAERNALVKKMNVIEPNGKTFFENIYLGKRLIIYFDEKSKDGVPQRARTKMEVRTWD